MRPFPRTTLPGGGVAKTRGGGLRDEFGEDLGADEETALVDGKDRPLIVSRFPAAIKSFYMQPTPRTPRSCSVLECWRRKATGEIIGGSQRIHDSRFRAPARRDKLPREKYDGTWTAALRDVSALRVRNGLERFVTWHVRIHHLREASPYPRTLKRIYP